jgi:uncharacterized lipoprotein YehR (DUF1307 family)
MRTIVSIVALSLSACGGGVLGIGEEEKFEVKVLGPDTVITYTVDGKVTQKESGTFCFLSNGMYVETNAPIIIEKINQ